MTTSSPWSSPYFEPNETNPYLKDFYGDMKRWSFQSQIYFLGRKFRLHQDLSHSEEPVIQDRTIYEDADFIDLCKGPHIPSAGKIGAFKLMSAAGSYWRGDATREPLQRIRGVAFENKKALEAYLQRLEEAKKRDHRKVGPELGLPATGLSSGS